MSRETKLNLIFIAVLMAVIVPGAVILIQKKMEPGARRIGDPDPVRRTVPYMDPLQTPLERISPPLTERWVKELGRTVAGPPHLSQARFYEMLEMKQAGNVLEVLLLAWQHQPGAAYQAAAQDKPARVEWVREVQIPADIRGELRRAGYIRPPATAALLRVITDAKGAALDGKIDLIVTATMSNEKKSDIVTLFTRPVASGK